MALIILRSVFIMVAIGLAVVIISSGLLAPEMSWLPWVVFFGVLLAAAGVIVGDVMTQRKKLDTISAVYFGLIVGLFLAYVAGLAIAPLFPTPPGGELQGNRVRDIVQMAFAAVLSYMCISFLIQTKNDFRFVIPYVVFSKEVKGRRPYILDTSVVIDGRISAKVKSGELLGRRIVVPEAVVAELEAVKTELPLQLPVAEPRADGVLLEEPVADAARLEPERRREPGRTGAAHRHHPVAPVQQVAEPLGGLEPLGDRVLDEPHPAELAHHVDAGARRLEELVHLGEVDAALRRPEDELDGVHRTLGGAAAVADAVGADEKGPDAVRDPDDIPLGTRLHAREAADADVGIEHRMKRRGDMESEISRRRQTRVIGFHREMVAGHDVGDTALYDVHLFGDWQHQRPPPGDRAESMTLRPSSTPGHYPAGCRVPS